MSKLSEELWTGFMHDSFNLVEGYRNLQAHQPIPHPPPPQPAQLSAVQPQQQQSLAFVHRSSAPQLGSPPSFCQQMTQPWQSGTDVQPHHGWPTFGPNFSDLNTSGLSGFLDPAAQTTTLYPVITENSPITLHK